MCLFCKIAQHEIPSTSVYEDDDILAFLDINPVTKGHTLIIPKQHYENLVDCPNDLFAKMHNVARSLTLHYDAVLNPAGYNYLSNTNEAAGQSIFHVHLHLIPRYDENDGLILHFNSPESAKLDEAAKLLLKQK